MSYAKPVRPSRRLKSMALDGAAAAGCTCKPEVELSRWHSDHVQEVLVRHDDDCPARHAARQLSAGRWSP